MAGQLYCARFVGGPSDGLVTVSSAPCLHDTVSLPADSFEVGPLEVAGRQKPGSWHAVYRVSCKRHAIENNCLTTRYEYEFSGLEFQPRTSNVQAKRRRPAAVIASVGDRVSRWCKLHFWFPRPEGRAPNDSLRRAAYRSEGVGGFSN